MHFILLILGLLIRSIQAFYNRPISFVRYLIIIKISMSYLTFFLNFIKDLLILDFVINLIIYFIKSTLFAIGTIFIINVTLYQIVVILLINYLMCFLQILLNIMIFLDIFFVILNVLKLSIHSVNWRHHDLLDTCWLFLAIAIYLWVFR